MAKPKTVKEIVALTPNITVRQDKLARNIIENSVRQRWDNAYDMLVDAGYTEKSARANAKTIIHTVGVRNALAKYGFTVETAKAGIAEIALTGNEGNRLRANVEILRALGEYAPEKHLNVNVSYIEMINKLNNNEG